MKIFLGFSRVQVICILFSTLIFFAVFYTNVFNYIELTTKYFTIKKDKVLCLIITNDEYIRTRAIPVWNTWAKKCYKALFAFNTQNFTNTLKSKDYFANEQEYRNALKLPLMHIDVTESYDNMANKVFEIIRKAYDSYFDDYNWFLLADDDTFIFVDHLYKFISTRSSEDFLTYGYNFKVTVPGGYHSGGAGSYPIYFIF